MGILIKGMDEIPEDGAVLVVKHDNGKAYIKHACTYGYSMELVKLPAVQPDHNADISKKVEQTGETAQNVQNEDLIQRKAAIDAVDSETVSTNPEHFKSSEKFIKFMKDADIASFGKWQWANGFNTALVATTIRLKALPSAQPEQPPYVAEIEAEYQKAVKMPHIHKPLAKALYEVWKKHDREDAERQEK